MAARTAKSPRTVEQSPRIRVSDPNTDRALEALRIMVERLATARQRAVVTVDLVLGLNKVRHGLGRAVTSYSITPTVADASFAHAIDRANPRPDLEVWILVAGAAQPAAVVEVS